MQRGRSREASSGPGEPVRPYSTDEVRAILAAAAQEVPNSARWEIALALGLRQGEVLGLRWSDIDLDRGLLTIRSTRVRRAYRHGCAVDCARFPVGVPSGSSSTGFPERPSRMPAAE